MADFEITAPDGRKFIVSGENAEGAYQALAQMLAQETPRGNGYGPDGMTSADRIASAKAGTLGMSPQREARQAEFDHLGEQQLRDPGVIGSLLAGATQGATLGFGDEMLGGLAANAGLVGDALTGNWSGMLDRTGERYAGMRDEVRDMLGDARYSRPWTATGAEVAGGMIPALTGIGAASSGASLPARVGLGAATGAAEGGLYGFGSGEGGVENRATNAAKMAAIGGIAGAAAPAAIAGLGKAWNAVKNPIASALNIPSDVRASEAVAKMLRRAGMSADDAKRAIDQAAADGQDAYKLVDALGLSGQRGLAGIARQPGDAARQEIAEFLTTRQAGQGDRLAGFVADALDAPDTAVARAAAMKTARDQAADLAYTAAREGAGPVDVRGALSVIDDRIGPMTGSGIADDGISGKFSRYRGRLAADDPAASVIKGETGIAGAGHNSAKTAVELSDFDRVLILKQEIGDDIGAAVRAGRNNEARELMKVQKALDEALEAASPGYRSANDEFAKASKAIGAVDAGEAAAGSRIRSEDTAAQFGGLADDGKSAFRAGYADPVIAKIDASAMGVNKARPLSGTKTAKDFDFLAKDPELIKRQIARENAMFETNVAALGGSKTADNLADAADMAGMVASIPGALVTQGWGAATRKVVEKLISGATGMNPSTREIIAKALLSSNPAAALAPAAKRAAQLETPRKVIEALIRSGALRSN